MADTRRIGIDGYNLALEKGTGVATYGRHLYQAVRTLGHPVQGVYGLRMGTREADLLQEIAAVDPAAIKLRRLQRLARRVTSAFVGTKARPLPLTGQVIMDPAAKRRYPEFDKIWNVPDLWGSSRLHFKTLRDRLTIHIPDRIDVMHWTYPLPIRLKGAQNVYTLHDLVPLRLPYTTLDDKRYYYRLCKMLAQKADHIITVSETSRRDIIDLLGVDENRVTNTYQVASVPADLVAKSDFDVQQEVEGIFGLDWRGYYLFFGAIEPKKNVGRLLQAYLTASNSQVKAPLVIVGSRAWKSDQELALLSPENADRVRMIEYAPYPLLVSLIRGARAVVFPSLYEGFGLPILEAMQLGTPVITSGSGSMKEVAGEAARFVDPYDPDTIYRAILDVDGSADLRAELSAAGLKQAEAFSAENYRQRLAELYARL